MTEICLFAGTTEGRRLAGFLEKQNIRLTVCAATEYGSGLIPESDNTTVFGKRMDKDGMIRMMREKAFDLVIDATHPYAVQVTENIAEACRVTGTPYRRLLRAESRADSSAVTVPDVPSAVEVLKESSGPVLLTTGSKELPSFAGLPRFAERVYARVLPLQASLDACSAVGLPASHIIAMQGPFTEAMNTAMLESIRAEWLVTKDSGDPGGFSAKAAAAEKTGTKLLIIGRPAQREGLSEGDLIRFLCDEFGFISRPQVRVIGTGPGGRACMTAESVETIEKADCLIGAKRLLADLARPGQEQFEAIVPEKISAFIQDHPEYDRYAVLMSGDSGFFSGTKRLLPFLDGCDVKVLPGISSLSYLCAKLGRSYEDIRTVSLHGRDACIASAVRCSQCVFILTGGENTPGSVCRRLMEWGLDQVRVTVGERLEYPDERILTGIPAEFAGSSFDSLSVMLIENDHADPVVTPGLPDELFRRDTGEKGLIPMTKSEIRAAALSKLQLTERSVCWDIGSGTGSVTIEMALQARQGSVYGIESDLTAVTLSRENAARFSADNVTIIHGTAPEACADLPTPTIVFIGGTSGKMKEILETLIARNAEMRVVAAAVTLDSVAELAEFMNAHPEIETDVVMIQTARGKKAGQHQLMMGGNPVYLFSMKISGKDA